MSDYSIAFLSFAIATICTEFLRIDPSFRDSHFAHFIWLQPASRKRP